MEDPRTTAYQSQNQRRRCRKGLSREVLVALSPGLRLGDILHIKKELFSKETTANPNRIQFSMKCRRIKCDFISKFKQLKEEFKKMWRRRSIRWTKRNSKWICK
ncbi:unnamed protein product [Caenorhabditis angaria]|uniref:Uncharacterized protein n=1 Tax=Caenorhabditis angaria TaxID=860376 RepID=A0A9P1NCL8_9PELO|nr:unnamed protein product [Caenorhabditis angaria]